MDDRRDIDKELTQKLDSIIFKVENISQHNEIQDEKLNEIHMIVTGNGTPENGLPVKVARHSEKINSIISTLKIHWALLSGIALAVVYGVVKLSFGI